MANILLEFTVNAPVEKVYKAITEAPGIRSWWTTDTRIEPKNGSQAHFGFGPDGFDFEIAELDPNRRVVWKTIMGLPDWGGTTVSFDLTEAEGKTKILFAHRGFESEAGSFARVSFNWAYFMMSLQAYLEKGQGTPAGA